MAGEWVKFEMTTPDKPEVIEMARLLRIDQDAVVGKLLRLWIWADENSVNGNAMSVTSAFLDRQTFCKGFAAAMRSVRWLEGEDGSLTFPRFDRHNGKTAKARAETNRRVVNHRERNAKGNEKSVTDVTQTPLQDALPKPLPEKRREEKKKKQEQTDLRSVVLGSKPRTTACPHEAIIAAYHEALPMLARVRDWTPQRQSLLRNAWRSKPERQDLAWWADLFAYIAQSDFLTGKGRTRGDAPAFEADLEWIIRPKNLPKIIEGKYENRSAA